MTGWREDGWLSARLVLTKRQVEACMLELNQCVVMSVERTPDSRLGQLNWFG